MKTKRAETIRRRLEYESECFVYWLYANLELSGFFPVDYRCERYAKRLKLPQAIWKKIILEECEKVNPRKNINFGKS